MVRERALEAAGCTPRPPAVEGVELRPLQREEFDCGFAYPFHRDTVRLDLSPAAEQELPAGVGS